MTLIDDKLATNREQSDAPAPGQPTRDRFRQPRKRPALVVRVALAAAAGLVAIAVAQTTTWPDRSGEPARPTAFADPPTVAGTGPDAVFVGPDPQFGGDPARGETDESYFARTGHHLPGLDSAVRVDGPWWHGQAPVYGGDPAPGETDESYFARTGHHLPSQPDVREAARRTRVTRDLVARGLIPAAALDPVPQRQNFHTTAP